MNYEFTILPIQVVSKLSRNPTRPWIRWPEDQTSEITRWTGFNHAGCKGAVTCPTLMHSSLKVGYIVMAWIVRIVAIRGGEKKLFFASQRRNCPLTSHFVDVDEIYHSLFFLLLRYFYTRRFVNQWTSVDLSILLSRLKHYCDNKL